MPWFPPILRSSVKERSVSLVGEKVSFFVLFQLDRSDKCHLSVGNLNEYSAHLWCTWLMNGALTNIHKYKAAYIVGNELLQKESGRMNEK